MSTICANVRRNLFKLVRLHFYIFFSSLLNVMPILFAMEMDGRREKKMKTEKKWENKWRQQQRQQQQQQQE